MTQEQQRPPPEGNGNTESVPNLIGDPTTVNVKIVPAINTIKACKKPKKGKCHKIFPKVLIEYSSLKV
jgi:hypothetical protein